MPSRVLREGLFDSSRFWSVSSDSVRLFFIGLVQCADDIGCVDLDPVYLQRHCLHPLKPATPEEIAKFISELIDVDLLRRYEKGSGVYGFIPRFRQRMRMARSRFPLPPDSLYADDAHAIAQIRKLTPARHLTVIGPQSASDCPAHDGQRSGT